MTTAAKLETLNANLAELERRRGARPLDFAKRLPWQQVAWSLLGGAPWRPEWGEPPTRAPHLVVGAQSVTECSAVDG